MTDGDRVPRSRNPNAAAEESRLKSKRRSSKREAVPHFTPAERAARGKAERAEVPRSSHAEWEPPHNRRDPVDLLEEQAESRVPELVPIRYGRMLMSPFTFFRGGAYLMAADLAVMPRTGLHAQLCGDAHLSNFGSFAAPDRQHRLQRQRLRRDASGPVRVGREAACCELRGRRSGAGFRRSDPPDRRADDRALLPRGDGELRGDARHRPLVHAPRHDEMLRALGEGSDGQGAQEIRP